MCWFGAYICIFMYFLPHKNGFNAYSTFICYRWWFFPHIIIVCVCLCVFVLLPIYNLNRYFFALLIRIRICFRHFLNQNKKHCCFNLYCRSAVFFLLWLFLFFFCWFCNFVRDLRFPSDFKMKINGHTSLTLVVVAVVVIVVVAGEYIDSFEFCGF